MFLGVLVKRGPVLSAILLFTRGQVVDRLAMVKEASMVPSPLANMAASQTRGLDLSSNNRILKMEHIAHLANNGGNAISLHILGCCDIFYHTDLLSVGPRHLKSEMMKLICSVYSKLQSGPPFRRKKKLILAHCKFCLLMFK